MRKTPFVNEEYYHVFNRGVEKRDIFSGDADYRRFSLSLLLVNSDDAGRMKRWQDFRSAHSHATLAAFLASDTPKPDFGSDPKSGFGEERIVDVVAYCLNPNHYHLLLRQKKERGIERFMQRLGTGYTKYFNAKYDRSGVLFQGKFRASHIDSDEYLLRVLVYIDCNSEAHDIAPAREYEWCSHRQWSLSGAEPVDSIISGRGNILGRFQDMAEYHRFAKSALVGIREQKEIMREIKEG